MWTFLVFTCPLVECCFPFWYHLPLCPFPSAAREPWSCCGHALFCCRLWLCTAGPARLARGKAHVVPFSSQLAPLLSRNKVPSFLWAALTLLVPITSQERRNRPRNSSGERRKGDWAKQSKKWWNLLEPERRRWTSTEFLNLSATSCPLSLSSSLFHWINLGVMEAEHPVIGMEGFEPRALTIKTKTLCCFCPTTHILGRDSFRHT